MYICLAPYSYVYKKEIKAGDMIVAKIEEYIAVNDSLPVSLRDIGLDSSLFINHCDGIARKTFRTGIKNDSARWPTYYYDIDDSCSYCVWFGTSLGEGIYYHSDSKTWDEKP